jgi:CO/xanthine dehydrogenase FAD-binding subunit
LASFVRPKELDQALALLAESPRVIVAGGTDHYPARVGRPLDDDVLDATALEALRSIDISQNDVRIGALATWTDVVETALPACFDGLKRAAREVGGVQIQNVGTVVGNLCNASPAADGTPCLMTLDAEIELASVDGRRSLPLPEFVLGNRRTARRPNELVTGIRVPLPGDRARSTFLKLGARRYLVISIVSVAAVVEVAADGTIAQARIAVGACSEVPCRLGALEAALAGRPLSPEIGDAVTMAHLAGLAPIGDVRGSADYRNDAAAILVRRALIELAEAR